MGSMRHSALGVRPVYDLPGLLIGPHLLCPGKGGQADPEGTPTLCTLLIWLWGAGSPAEAGPPSLLPPHPQGLSSSSTISYSSLMSSFSSCCLGPAWGFR